MNIGNVLLTVSGLGLFTLGGLHFVLPIMGKPMDPMIVLIGAATSFILWIVGGFLSSRISS